MPRRDVVVVNPGREPWGESFYKCEGVEGVALGSTTPLPPCFRTRVALV